MRVLAVACLLAFLAPAATAQHEHGASTAVVIAHDSNAAGDEFVGNLAHFGILDLGDDVVPDFHQQNHIKVTLNGATILETTADSGHDYDGVNMFDVTFPVAGDYTVADYDEAGHMLAMFNGTVREQTQAHRALATLVLDGPDSVVGGTAATFTYHLAEDGRPINHTDAWFEVRDASGLIFRTKTHSHTEEQQVSYFYTGFAGAYTVRVTGFLAFPGATGQTFSPVTAEKKVTITQGVPATPGATPAPPTMPDAPTTNAVVQGAITSPFNLVGTYDPSTTVGPNTQMRLTALAMDPVTHRPVPHVNFAATLTEPSLGYTLFSSKTLHEYDGIYEFAAVQPEGQYVLSVDATRGNWTSHIDMPYTVAPPALVALPGSGQIPISLAEPVELVDVGGLDALKAGVPFNLTLFIHDAAGNPLEHAEADVVVASPIVPVVMAKLHTHETGKFQMTGALPFGEYVLYLTPFSLEPRPTSQYFAFACDGPAVCLTGEVHFRVGNGPGFPAAAPTSHPAAASADEQPVPDVGVGAGLMVLSAALVIARRRR